jgi:N-acetylglucosamine-6-phosphate deacetylase
MVFANATVFTGSEFLTDASLEIANGLITGFLTEETIDPDVLDLAGDYLIPGLVDLQLYGGSWQFMNETPTPETVRHVHDTHLQDGTTSVMPTLYSASHGVILQAIEAVRAVMQERPGGVLGLHVEGPYLNPVRRGAHSPNLVRNPDKQELAELFTIGADVIKLMTIAPEIFAPEMLDWLQEIGPDTFFSLGHSNATYAEAMAAFDNGIDLVTHLYNAQRGFESREPGVVGAVFDHPTAQASLIADGFHCAPAAIRLAHRVLGPERLFLISDASFANPPRPAFDLDDFQIRYDNGRYLNQEGKLAGSSITLLEAVRVCVYQAGLPLADALKMATQTPANVIARSDLGRIEPGCVANLVWLDKSLAVKGVWLNGKLLVSV